MKLKNPNKECKYQTEIYYNENKLISKKEFKIDINEIINRELQIFYNFTKSQSITIILIKHLNLNKNLIF